MPNAIEGKFKIDNHEFKQELTDVDSDEYKNMVKNLEAEVSSVVSLAFVIPCVCANNSFSICYIYLPF